MDTRLRHKTQRREHEGGASGRHQLDRRVAIQAGPDRRGHSLLRGGARRDPGNWSATIPRSSVTGWPWTSATRGLPASTARSGDSRRHSPCSTRPRSCWKRSRESGPRIIITWRAASVFASRPPPRTGPRTKSRPAAGTVIVRCSRCGARSPAASSLRSLPVGPQPGPAARPQRLPGNALGSRLPGRSLRGVGGAGRRIAFASRDRTVSLRDATPLTPKPDGLRRGGDNGFRHSVLVGPIKIPMVAMRQTTLFVWVAFHNPNYLYSWLVLLHMSQ